MSKGPARFDVDRDGRITDQDLAAATPPRAWRRIGLRGPAIILRWFTRNAKRLFVLAIGCSVVIAGVAMLVLPGPGVLIILVGLAILATEFAWAERALDRTTARASKTLVSVQGSTAGRGMLALSGFGLIAIGIGGPLVLDRYWAMGASLVLAGLIGLGTLLPPVQRWLERQQTRG